MLDHSLLPPMLFADLAAGRIPSNVPSNTTAVWRR
jgi:hypothetical protein